MQIIEMKTADLKPYPYNTKKHDQTQIDNVAESIKEFGFVQPLVVDSDNVVVIGHCRLLRAKKLKMKTVPCYRAEELTEEQTRKLRILDNKTNESPWDFDFLETELADLDLSNYDLDFELISNEKSLSEKYQDYKSGSLSEDFVAPPLSVLNRRAGDWQKRKKMWREQIKDTGESRGKAKESFSVGSKYDGYASVSLLDPVLREIIVKWFSPKSENGNKCYDCFAGDTVFGYVARSLGKEFTGIELREEQVLFNNSRAKESGINAHYICDDGRNILSHISAESQDLLFSCPPYYDLEVYSDKPNDASNQDSYEEFYSILNEAFKNAIKCLKENRFRVVVASDVRSEKGGYYDFISDIKKTFISSGCMLYNELILLDPIGTAALRARNSFKTRKITRTHQEILVFFKGDPKKIKEIFGEVEVADYECENEQMV